MNNSTKEEEKGCNIIKKNNILEDLIKWKNQEIYENSNFFVNNVYENSNNIKAVQVENISDLIILIEEINNKVKFE